MVKRLLLLTLLITALLTAALSMAQGTPLPADIACSNGMRTRLIVHERGRVTDHDERPSRLRSGPGTNYDILTTIENTSVFLVVEGPECSDQYTWYRIRYQNYDGWIAEGEPGLYYVEPYLSS